MAGNRTYLEVVRDAAQLLGAQVRAGRVERRWTIADLARRAGVSKATVVKTEKGDPGVSLGIAFQLAALVGVRLFDRDERELAADARSAKAALLGKRVRAKAEPETDLDF